MGKRDPHRVLEEVARDPGAAGARERAEGALREIARGAARAKGGRPRAADVAAVARHARVLANLGAGAEARALLEAWRARGVRSEAAQIAGAVIALTTDPAAASVRLRALARRDPSTAAFEAVSAVLRGDFRAAIALAATHDGFAPASGSRRGGAVVAGATDALTYVLLAHVLHDRFAEAEALLARWRGRARGRTGDPALAVALLRAEALVAAYANRHADEVARLEEARVICEEHALGESAVFVDVALAVAHARIGDLDRARSLARAGDAGAGKRATTIAVYRDLAALEIALLSGRHAEAEALVERVLPYVRATTNVVLELLVRFAHVLCAPEPRFREALAAYAQLARRHPLPYHQRRLRFVEAHAAAGAPTLRGTDLIERDRWGERRVPLVRAWNPSAAALAADLYVDRVHGTLRIRGGAAAPLGERPILSRALAVVLDAPSFALPLHTFFERVWDAKWDPLRHEGKCHVTLHRLRAWLAGLGAGDDPFVDLVDSTVRIHPARDVRVLDGAIR